MVLITRQLDARNIATQRAHLVAVKFAHHGRQRRVLIAIKDQNRCNRLHRIVDRACNNGLCPCQGILGLRPQHGLVIIAIVEVNRVGRDMDAFVEVDLIKQLCTFIGENVAELQLIWERSLRAPQIHRHMREGKAID